IKTGGRWPPIAPGPRLPTIEVRQQTIEVQRQEGALTCRQRRLRNRHMGDISNREHGLHLPCLPIAWADLPRPYRNLCNPVAGLVCYPCCRFAYPSPLAGEGSGERGA